MKERYGSQAGAVETRPCFFCLSPPVPGTVGVTYAVPAAAFGRWEPLLYEFGDKPLDGRWLFLMCVSCARKSEQGTLDPGAVVAQYIHDLSLLAAGRRVPGKGDVADG